MNSRFVFFKKHSVVIYLLPLGIFLALWWLLPRGFIVSVQQAFIEVQAPLYNVVLNGHNFKNFLKKNFVNKKNLIADYENLMRTNFYLQMRINNLLDFIERNHIKSNDFDLKDERFKFVYANVIRRDLIVWANYLVINRGKKDGISIGDGVISKCNVVGRIKEVYDNLSLVELLSSPTFKMSACFEGEHFPIVFQGNGSDILTKYTGIAENIIPQTDKDINGARLVSSHLNNIFPGGLTVGYIADVTDIKDGIFFKAVVNLDATFINSLHEVVVLTHNDSIL